MAMIVVFLLWLAAVPLRGSSVDTSAASHASSQELQDMFLRLQAELAAKQESLDVMQADHEAELAAKQESLEVMQAKQADHEAELAATQAELAAKQASLDVMQAELAAKQESLEVMQAKQADHEGQLAAKQESLDVVQAKLESCEERFDGVQAARIAQLEAQVRVLSAERTRADDPEVDPFQKQNEQWNNPRSDSRRLSAPIISTTEPLAATTHHLEPATTPEAPFAVTTADATPESLATTAVLECETDVIQLYTGEYASEVSWTIFAGSNVHCEGSGYASNNNHVAISCCLAAGATYKLSCKDSYSDGWNGGYLTIGKDNFCSDFSSGSLKTEEFVGGNLPAPCTSTDGSGLSDTYPCGCGSATCTGASTTHGLCNAVTSTCSAPCSITDGSAVSTAYPCVCGNTTCTQTSDGCSADTSTCATAPCSVTDGSTVSDAYPCVCGASNCDLDMGSGWTASCNATSDVPCTQVCITPQEGTQVSAGTACPVGAVVICDGVTTIPSYAFWGCDAITEVDFPDSLTTIGNWAFHGCFALTQVDFGNSLTTIEGRAFYDCFALTQVTIRSVGIKFGDDAFEGCTSLNKVIFAAGEVDAYEWGYMLTNFSEVVLDGSVRKIGPNAFKNSEHLVKVTMGDNVTEIGESAFQNCTSLRTVTISESVTRIASRAFKDCRQLEQVYIRGSVTDVGDHIFNSTNLQKVVYEPPSTTVPDFKFRDCCAAVKVELANCTTTIAERAFQNLQIHEVDIPESVTEIPKFAFLDCANLSEVDLPESVQSIGEGAFQDCSALSKVKMGNAVAEIGTNAFKQCSSLIDVKLPDATTKIGDAAFQGCVELSKVTLGENMTTIGKFAFHDCSKLQTVSTLSSRGQGRTAQAWFGGSLEAIGESAFQGTALPSVHIPASVKTLEKKAFARNPYLSTVTIEGTSRSFEEVGFNVFYETCGITDVIIDVTNDLETMIVLPACAKVTNVTVAGGLVSKAWLSSNCDYLTSLRVSNDKIPAKAWKGCASLNNIDFDGNVMEIDSHAFDGCSALVAVRLHGASMRIGDGAFRNCSRLASVTANGLTHLGTEAFAYCSSLAQAHFPNADVRDISGDAFRACTSMTKFTVPPSVKSVSINAFDDCLSLAELHLPYELDQVYRISGEKLSAEMKVFVNMSGSEGERAYPKSWFDQAKACSDGFKPRLGTKSELQCQCPAMHRFESSTMRCEPCSKDGSNAVGLNCPGGYLQSSDDQLDTTVLVKSGYMTLPQNPYSVFLCVEPETRCATERPVGSIDMCDSGHDPLQPQCSLCPPGQIENADGECEPCGEQDGSYVVMTMLRAALAACMALVFLWKAYVDSFAVSTARDAIIAVAIEFYQITQALFRLDVTFPSVLLSFQIAFNFLTIPSVFEKFRFNEECALKARGYLFTIMRQALTPLILFMGFATLQLIYYAVRRKSLDRDHVLSITGAFFTGLFISFLGLSLSLFYVMEMPNKKLMVSAFPELEYRGEEWWLAVPINLVSFLVYNVPIISFVIYAVWKAPTLAAVPNSTFLDRFDFCFGGVRPDRWWWILVQLAYGLTLTGAQVLLPSSVRTQVYFTLLLTFLFTMAEFAVMPSEFDDGNRVSVALKVSLIIFLIVMTEFIPITESTEELEQTKTTWAWVAVACGAGAIAFTVARFATQVYYALMPSDVRDAQAHGPVWQLRDIAALVLLMPEHEIANKVREFQDMDQESIRTASKALVNLLFGEQVSDKWVQKRLISESGDAVWDHSRRMAKMLRDSEAGRVAQIHAQSTRIRTEIIKIADKIYRHNVTNSHADVVMARMGHIDQDIDSALAIHRTVSNAVQSSVSSHSDAAEAENQAPVSIRERVLMAMGMVERPMDPMSVLSMDGFKLLLSDLQTGTSAENAEAIFRMLDIDESDQVSIAEIVDMLAALAPRKLVAEFNSEEVSDEISNSDAPVQLVGQEPVH